MKRRELLPSVLLVAAMLLPACATAPPELDCASEEIFCVGLVTDGGKINDQSLNQAAWEGLQRAEKDLGAHIRYAETSDAGDYPKSIAALGDEGYDVIVTVGSAMAEPTARAAEAYPKTDFIGVDQVQAKVVDGMAGLTFAEDSAGFLVGALAAMMSTNNKIGALCGTDMDPTAWRYIEGFKAGAAFADQFKGIATEVVVMDPNNVGSNPTLMESDWGAATAQAMLEQGADAIFGCGGVSGNSALTAAARAGAYAIGVNIDQYLTLPEAAPRMLSSGIKLVTPGVLELIKLSRDGQFPSGNYLGNVGYAPFHELDDEVPLSVKKMMEQIDAGLRDGSIKTNVSLLSD